MLTIVALIVAAVVLLVIPGSVGIVQQGLGGVVKRLGQFHTIRPSGLTSLIPFVDNMTTIDVRETPRTGDRQEVITRDNVSVAVNATIFSQVVEPRLALFSVSNYLVAIDNQARTTLRAVFGSMSLDDALSQRERINAELQAQMEAVTDKWGVRIHRIEIVDIAPPEQILRAMALQKTANQEKRAAILLSEGQQQSAINVAEGAKQAAIKNAEGERQAQILRAEGQKQAAILEAEGRSKAINAIYGAIHDGHPDPELLAVLHLATLPRFPTTPNPNIMVPYESAGLVGAAQGGSPRLR